MKFNGSYDFTDYDVLDALKEDKRLVESATQLPSKEHDDWIAYWSNIDFDLDLLWEVNKYARASYAYRVYKESGAEVEEIERALHENVFAQQDAIKRYVEKNLEHLNWSYLTTSVHMVAEDSAYKN